MTDLAWFSSLSRLATTRVVTWKSSRAPSIGVLACGISWEPYLYYLETQHSTHIMALTGYVDISAERFFSNGEIQGFQFEYNYGMITVLLEISIFQ